MITLISILGALALATIPIAFGWRRTVDEAGMARAMGIAQPKKKFDPEKFARQTGTGLAFNQIAYGFLAWVGGGLAGGIFLGVFPAILFAIAGGLLYAGTLSDKRQEFRLKQAKDILRGLGVVETLLSVSYTHLDVYKRQALHSLWCLRWPVLLGRRLDPARRSARNRKDFLAAADDLRVCLPAYSICHWLL